jgi:hypothetical protein
MKEFGSREMYDLQELEKRFKRANKNKNWGKLHAALIIERARLSLFSDGEPDANTIKFIEDNSELRVYAYKEGGMEYTGLQYGSIKVDVKAEKL